MRDTVKIHEWGEPPLPPPHRGANARLEYSEVAEQLVEHPSEWALINISDTKRLRFAQQLVTRVNTGRIAAFSSDDGKFEAVSRSISDIKTGVYVRFMPVETS